MRFGAWITDAAISLPETSSPGSGSRLVFEGIVRPLEGDRVIRGLRYDAYMPMAQLELGRLAGSICVSHGLHGLRVVHRRGLVGAGEASVVIEVWSAHRAASLEAMGAFLDRMKRDVPIWKTPVE